MRTECRPVLAACYAAAIAVGCGSPVQGGINTRLAALLGDGVATTPSNVTAAAAVSFGTGLVCLVVMNAAQTLWLWRRRQPIGLRPPRHAWECIGGVLGSCVMVLSLLSLPRIGFASFSVLRAAGASAASLSLDHLGGCGVVVRRVTRRRLLGVGLMILGSLLATSHREDVGVASAEGSTAGAPAYFALMALVGGALLPLQASVNGRLAARLGAPLRATLVSFVAGLGCLAMGVALLGPPAGAAAALGAVPGWLLLGGPLGLMLVTSNLILPGYIGFASTTSFTIAGNLGCSLLLDATGSFNLGARPPSAVRLAGAACALVGAALSVAPRPGAAATAAVSAAAAEADKGLSLASADAAGAAPPQMEAREPAAAEGDDAS